MSDIAITIEDLRKCAAAINEAANSIAELLGTEKQTPVTLEEVRAVLANKSRAGYTAQIRSLLQKYGTDKLSGVDPANYKALLADAEELNNAT